jgi:hypothetical protein
MMNDIWTWLGSTQADGFLAGMFLMMFAISVNDYRDRKKFGKGISPLVPSIFLILFIINFSQSVGWIG